MSERASSDVLPKNGGVFLQTLFLFGLVAGMEDIVKLEC